MLNKAFYFIFTTVFILTSTASAGELLSLIQTLEEKETSLTFEIQEMQQQSHQQELEKAEAKRKQIKEIRSYREQLQSIRTEQKALDEMKLEKEGGKMINPQVLAEQEKKLQRLRYNLGYTDDPFKKYSIPLSSAGPDPLASLESAANRIDRAVHPDQLKFNEAKLYFQSYAKMLLQHPHYNQETGKLANKLLKIQSAEDLARLSPKVLGQLISHSNNPNHSRAFLAFIAENKIPLSQQQMADLSEKLTVIRHAQESFADSNSAVKKLQKQSQNTVGKTNPYSLTKSGGIRRALLSARVLGPIAFGLLAASGVLAEEQPESSSSSEISTAAPSALAGAVPGFSRQSQPDSAK